MPKPRSLSDIKSKLLRPALTSHFGVQVSIPDGLRSFLGPNQDTLNLLCSEAVLPGSQLTTFEINNDRTGVTERHAYRRMFDDRIDLTFYVDAGDYLPIKFFETWMKYIVNESPEAVGKEYFYRIRYPDEYIADQGLKVLKFERDYSGGLEYEFVRSFPLSISSMPVSYDASSLLKCTVSMSYIRYVVRPLQDVSTTTQPVTIAEQGYFNSSPDFLLNPQFGIQGPQSTPRRGVANDFLNIGNPALDQFGVQIPRGTIQDLGVTGAIINA